MPNCLPHPRSNALSLACLLTFFPAAPGIEPPPLQTVSSPQDSPAPLSNQDKDQSVISSTGETDGNSLWKRPGQHCLWKIHFRYAPTGTETPNPSDFKVDRVQQVTLTQHGREYLQEVQMEGGKKWEYWSLSAAELYGQSGETSLALRPARGRHARRNGSHLRPEEITNDLQDPESTPANFKSGSSGGEDYHSLDALRWIRPEHYKTTLEMDGQQVLLFILTPEASQKADSGAKNHYYRSPLGGLPMRPGFTAAAIHAGTRLPAFLQKDNEWRVYEFTPLRNQRLLYPGRVTSFLESLAPAFKAEPKPLP